MSYLNTAGMPLYHPPQFEAGTGRTLKMDTLHLPAIESNTMSVDPDEFLKKMSDTLANAFGLEFSRLFRDGKLLNL